MTRGPAFSAIVIGAISATLKAPPSTASRARVSVSIACEASWSAGEPIGLRGGLAEVAHRAAGLVGVFQAVHHHVVDDPVMPGAIAAARLMANK